jgi:hypothetical protein
VRGISRVDEICALLGNYATYSGNWLSTFRDNLSAPCSRVENPVGCGFLILEDGTYRLCRNVVEQLPLYTA